MFQKKFLATFAALFLLLAGLFLLYHSNINETVFLDIAADNPIRVSADEQEEGIAVDENNDGSIGQKPFIFKIPAMKLSS